MGPILSVVRKNRSPAFRSGIHSVFMNICCITRISLDLQPASSVAPRWYLGTVYKNYSQDPERSSP